MITVLAGVALLVVTLVLLVGTFAVVGWVQHRFDRDFTGKQILAVLVGVGVLVVLVMGIGSVGDLPSPVEVDLPVTVNLGVGDSR